MKTFEIKGYIFTASEFAYISVDFREMLSLTSLPEIHISNMLLCMH